jgi:hypothetical protein
MPPGLETCLLLQLLIPVIAVGYPLLTSAHPGSAEDLANDTVSLLTNKIIYDPIILTLYTRCRIGAMVQPRARAPDQGTQ